MEFAKWLGQQVFAAVVGGDWGGEEDDSSVVDLQCGKTVFHDVPAKMRTELWLSQLHRGGSGAAAAQQYRSLLAHGVPQEVLAEIDKDMHRTFAGHKRLGTEEGQAAMLRVLAAYAASDPQIGYTQGMNFLAGLLLTYIDSEAEAFGALYMLMHDRGLRELYNPDMRLLQVRLWQLGRLLPARLSAHLEAHAVLPVLYASSWLLTCYASDFPLSFAARVLDLVITDCWAAPMMKVAVGILSRCEMLLLEMQDFEVMVELIRQDVPRWPRQELQELLTECFSQPWTKRQLRVLEQINNAETVVEAVTRVHNLRSSTLSEAAEAPPQIAAAASAFSAASGSLSIDPSGSSLAAAESGLAAQAAVDGPVPATAIVQQEGAEGEAGAQQQQMTPRTAAAAEVLLIKPLPPPPRSRQEQGSWAQWQSTTQQLEAVPSSQVRIEVDIGSHIELDEKLSQALSYYQGSSSSPDVSFKICQPAVVDAAAGAAAGAGGLQLQAGPATGQESAAGAAPAAVGPGAESAAAAERVSPAPRPSPFDGRADGHWLPAISELQPVVQPSVPKTSTATADLLASFTVAGSSAMLLRPEQRPTQQQLQQPATRPAAAGKQAMPPSPLQALLGLFVGRAAPSSSPQPSGSSVADGLQGLKLDGPGAGQAEQQNTDLSPALDEFGSWKTATNTTVSQDDSRSNSPELVSTASGAQAVLQRRSGDGTPRSSSSTMAASNTPRLAAQARLAQLQQAHADDFALTGRQSNGG